MNNKAAREMCMPLHAIQKTHKVNENIASSRHGNSPEHVTIKNGISSELSPAAIILGPPKTDYNKISITFGSYTQVYIGITNSTKQRTRG